MWKSVVRSLVSSATILSLAAFATGCAPVLTHIPPETVARGIDFRPHTRDGFLFSPNAYSGAFDPIGLVTVTVFAEGDKKLNKYNAEEWRFSAVGADEALAEARKQAAALGADAIVNVVLSATTKSIAERAGAVIVPGIELRGFAIKRK